MSRHLLFGLITLLLLGCTRDDICPEDTASTPLLIITFKDRTNPLESKNVSGLRIETNTNDPVVIVNATEAMDSIAIPLNTNADQVSYRFIEEAGEAEENVDIVSMTYERADSYVNRACSFKTNYSNLVAMRENEGIENWIFSLTVLKTTVEDETEAHITILH